MIEPKDDISISIEFRSCHRHRLVGIVGEDSERAGGIEADSTNRGRLDIIVVKSALN